MENDIPRQIAFATTEAALATRLDIPPDALIPLLFSLRYGGDWSYASEDVTAISALKRTTIYDDKSKTGYSHEEIYLFTNPVLLHREGKVRRLEKCSEAPARLLVERPYIVRIGADRIFKMTVDPLERDIRTEEVDATEMTFSGPTAYGIDHEMEHLVGQDIVGEGIWTFKFR